MPNNTDIIKNTTDIFRFNLQPLNENQDLNFIEPFTGTITEMIEKSRNILKGLKQVLNNGEFTIKVSSEMYEQCWVVDLKHIYSSEYEVII